MRMSIFRFGWECCGSFFPRSCSSVDFLEHCSTSETWRFRGCQKQIWLWMGFDAGWPTAGPMGPEVIAADTNAGAGQFSTIGAWGIPIWNTLILLTSSVTVTIAHWALKKDQRKLLIGWLVVTVVLGFLFLFLQASEYIHAYSELGLTLGTGVYGATFFMLTGFHGAHVTIGAIILAVILIRCIRGHFTSDNHFGFEAAAWYWHFVDTVWVGLFIFVYVV